jgi:hypothetical protein
MGVCHEFYIRVGTGRASSQGRCPEEAERKRRKFILPGTEELNPIKL